MNEINVGMIENALKCLAGQKACDLCVYDDRAMQDGERTCINLVAEDTLDLIHRLRNENAELKEDNERWETMFHICEERKYRKMFNEEWKKEYQKELDKQGKGLIAGSPDFDYVYQRYFEQKAEIERLKEEHKRIAWSKQQYLDWVHGFLTTHTDMKNRGEDYKMFDRDWMCDVFWAKIEGSIEYIIDLENQRNKLQKQVDKLKEENTELYKEHTALIAGSILQKQNIAKDTVKEICLGIVKDMPIPIKEKWLEWFREHYGVEVE